MQLVEHIFYGKGKILKERYGGFELYVNFFEDGFRRWVRRDEIRFLSETPVLIKYKPAKRVLSEKQFKARQIVEALRLGIVPHKYAEEFTFGREEEIKQIKSWLDNSSEGVLKIIGEYGIGKTHILEYIYSIALNNNWAVSVVELDPNEAPFHKPKSIYQKIISSFRFKSLNGDFREFLRQIAKHPDSYKLNEHKYLSGVVSKIKNGTDDEDMWEWIEGNSAGYHYPHMYPYSTCANIYCYILSGIGRAAKNILGLNGLLILFDEAESVDPYWYTYYQNNKAWNFLTGIVLMANNNENLLREVRENLRGKYTDLQYCGYSKLPFVWEIPCYVKIVFTFTPNQWILDREPLKNLKKIELEHLDNKSLINISKAIVNLYQKAYNFQPNKDQVVKAFDLIPKDKTRLLVKKTVEFLDLMRFYPDVSIEYLLR